VLKRDYGKETSYGAAELTEAEKNAIIKQEEDRRKRDEEIRSRNIENQRKLKQKIADGKITLNLFPPKQNPHIYGTKEYISSANKSYFTVSFDMLQSFIRTNYATGAVLISPKVQIKEILTFSEKGAYLVDPDSGIFIG